MAYPILGTPVPYFQVAGSPLANGTVNVQDPTDSSVLPSYPTADDADAGTNANSDPITLNANGEPPNQMWGVDGQSYRLIVKNAAGATVHTIDDQQVVGRLPGFHTSQYGVIGDGTTDDTVALQAAVTAANSAGAMLSFTDGQTILTTASIANFHDVLKRGDATIKRGTDTFDIEPVNTKAQKIYIATTGLDSNDGLSASEPFLTCQAALDAMMDSSRGVIRGQLEFHMAAGTYTSGYNFDSLLATQRPIYIYGPTQGHPNVPTAIIDGTSDASGSGVQARIGAWLIITDLKIINYSSGKGFDNNRGTMTLTNCHTDNCLTAVQGQHAGCHTTINGGDFDGNSLASSQGYSGLFNATHSISAASTAAAADFHHFATGVFLHEGTQGHLDYTIIEDCTTVGLEMSRGCGAVNTKQMQIYRNAIGILVENSGWFNNGIDLGSGANANTVNVRTLGSSPEHDALCSDNETRTLRTFDPVFTGITHTGNTTETLVWTPLQARDWTASEAGHLTILTMFGSNTALVGTCGIKVYIWDGSTEDWVGGVSLPAGADEWWWECRIYNSGLTAQRAVHKFVTSAAQGVDYNTGTQALKNAAWEIRVKFELSNGSDTCTAVTADCATTVFG